LSKSQGRVFPIFFTIVDGVGSLGKYNWAELVYEYLVAFMFLMEKRNNRHFHIVGCVYLLQVFGNQSL